MKLLGNFEVHYLVEDRSRRLVSDIQLFQANSVFLLPRQSVIDKELKAWAKAAGLTNKRISFHKSRHTFATMSLSFGNDLYTTSKLLGHKSIQTTQIYAKVTDKMREEAAARFPTIKITEPSKTK